MANAPRRPQEPEPSPADPLDRALGAILAEARSQVVAGRPPDRRALEGRVRAAAKRRRAELGAAAADGIGVAERAALAGIERILAVHRAYGRVAADPVAAEAAPPAPVAAPRRFTAVRTRPTVSGNMEVRRDGAGGTLTLSWDGVPAVRTWEVRISERPDPRGDYEQRDTVTLAPGVTTISLALREHPFRVNVLGKARDGRTVRRALISALTADNWTARWERRASAS